MKHTIDTSLAENPIAITAEGIIIGPVEHLQKAGILTQEIICDSRTLLESVKTGLRSTIEPELISLNNLFEGITGFGAFINKRIKAATKHILGIEFSWSRKGKPQINGFHHDYKRIIANRDIFNFEYKTITKYGFYKADIFYHGDLIKHGATFFPSHWTRKKVMQKIKEAYVHALENKSPIVITSQGSQIDGLIQEGVIIRMHITNNGVIKSAYPLLE